MATVFIKKFPDSGYLAVLVEDGDIVWQAEGDTLGDVYELLKSQDEDAYKDIPALYDF